MRPLQALASPLPDFKPPSRKEERTIAQRNQDNIANAIDNMRYIGLHVIGVQPQVKSESIINTKLVSSSTSLGSNAEFKLRENVARAGKTQPSSEAGTESSKA